MVFMLKIKYMFFTSLYYIHRSATMYSPHYNFYFKHQSILYLLQDNIIFITFQIVFTTFQFCIHHTHIILECGEYTQSNIIFNTVETRIHHNQILHWQKSDVEFTHNRIHHNVFYLHLFRETCFQNCIVMFLMLRYHLQYQVDEFLEILLDICFFKQPPQVSFLRCGGCEKETK